MNGDVSLERRHVERGLLFRPRQPVMIFHQRAIVRQNRDRRRRTRASRRAGGEPAAQIVEVFKPTASSAARRRMLPQPIERAGIDRAAAACVPTMKLASYHSVASGKTSRNVRMISVYSTPAADGRSTAAPRRRPSARCAPA